MLRQTARWYGDKPFMVNLDDFAPGAGESGTSATGAAGGTGGASDGAPAAGGASAHGGQPSAYETNPARAQAVAEAAAQAASAAASKLSAAAVKCGIAVFRELGFIEARPGCFCGERIWAIRVKRRPEKVDLMESVRFREGLGEIEESRAFSKWALSATAEELLAHIVYPIIPKQC